MKIITVAKTKITITSEGCCDCGGPLDSDAREAGTVGLSVAGIQRTPIQLWRCAKCAEEQKDEGWFQPSSDPNAPKEYYESRCPDHGTMMPCTLNHENGWRKTLAQLQKTPSGGRNAGS